MSDDEFDVEMDTTYPACIADVDEKRRAFIMQWMANADIDGSIFIQNCALVEAWIKTGAVPGKSKPVARSVKDLT